MIRKLLKKSLGAIGFDLVRNSQRHDWHRACELLGFVPDRGALPFLSESTTLLKELKDKGAQFFMQERVLIVAVQGSTFIVDSWEELFILHEIYVEEVYHWQLPRRFALIDVGMNTGAASLYFAEKENCEQVFAFEPFEETIRKAEQNFVLNGHARKIKKHQTGLGYPERTVSVSFAPSLKGSSGLSEQPHVRSAPDKIVRDLAISDAAAAFRSVFNQYEGVLVAKIDCEGAEYEILDRLHQTGLLQRVSLFMIEWHHRGAEPLCQLFRKEGYAFLVQPAPAEGRGMIYAIKNL